jgi:hypothetical protein
LLVELDVAHLLVPFAPLGPAAEVANIHAQLD